MDLLISRFFFALGTVSCLNSFFFDAKTIAKPQDSTIEHIKHERQCAFGA
jgi:hypothetical protein